MDEFNTFMALSFRLTGLPALQVPDQPEITMGEDYLQRLNEQFGADFKALLALYSSVGGTGPVEGTTGQPAIQRPGGIDGQRDGQPDADIGCTDAAHGSSDPQTPAHRCLTTLSLRTNGSIRSN